MNRGKYYYQMLCIKKKKPQGNQLQCNVIKEARGKKHRKIIAL